MAILNKCLFAQIALEKDLVAIVFFDPRRLLFGTTNSAVAFEISDEIDWVK